jgi:hypothetical protein
LLKWFDEGSRKKEEERRERKEWKRGRDGM